MKNSQEEFEGTKGVIRISKKNRQHNGQKKKNRQHNGQKKKYKRTNNDLQNIVILRQTSTMTNNIYKFYLTESMF